MQQYLYPEDILPSTNETINKTCNILSTHSSDAWLYMTKFSFRVVPPWHIFKSLRLWNRLERLPFWDQASNQSKFWNKTNSYQEWFCYLRSYDQYHNCFSNCQAVTNIQIPLSVEDIEAGAFSDSGLRSIEISENVNQIGMGACRNCLFLERVTFHSSTTNLMMANDIFDNCPLLSVINIYPWLWPKFFASMQGHPAFLFRFFRQYHTKILNFETPTDVSVRLLWRLRRDKRRRRWWYYSLGRYQKNRKQQEHSIKL